MQNSTSKVRVLTGTAMLGAVAAVLMYLEFPIPIMPAFVKLDVSELPALIASVMGLPAAGGTGVFCGTGVMYCTSGVGVGVTYT